MLTHMACASYSPLKKELYLKHMLWIRHKLEVPAQEEKNYMKKTVATYSGDGGAQLEGGWQISL